MSRIKTNESVTINQWILYITASWHLRITWGRRVFGCDFDHFTTIKGMRKKWKTVKMPDTVWLWTVYETIFDKTWVQIFCFHNTHIKLLVMMRRIKLQQHQEIKRYRGKACQNMPRSHFTDTHTHIRTIKKIILIRTLPIFPLAKISLPQIKKYILYISIVFIYGSKSLIYTKMIIALQHFYIYISIYI